jgi:hypothetical protein
MDGIFLKRRKDSMTFLRLLFTNNIYIKKPQQENLKSSK